MKRILGRSGIEVSALGLGCWAIGGPWNMSGGAAGWGVVDDAESDRAIHRAIDLGVTFFDTAANYGCGHSERVLGNAIRGKRDKVVIASKFGYRVNEEATEVTPYGSTEEASDVAPHVREDVEKTLSRLGTDYLDVCFLHVWGLELDRALEARRELEKLVAEGKVRTFGWSTDRLDAIQSFASSPHCSVVEQQFSVFDGNGDLLDFCERESLGSAIRGPLAMGILTGKFSADTKFGADDFRQKVAWHPGYENGKPKKVWLDALASVREILTSDGRTLAQGSLAWLWARSPAAIPIPGFRNERQAEENARAMEKGPLAAAQMAEIERLLSREAL
jgi:aryl-alcohol dehydrogenase-like predicted oxidoreductase